MTLGTVIGVKATEGNRFCGYSCHEMNQYAQTWAAGKHSNVDCVKCHIPPGLKNLAKTKFFALRELYVHYLGTVPSPIGVTRGVQNSICTPCHSAASLSNTIHLVTADFTHAAGHTKFAKHATRNRRPRRWGRPTAASIVTATITTIRS